ncbi:GGDEF domain-containing protein [Actinophytocola oryzae]|uniref:PAS domain S-box-containing protein/diguanylate cyclase (GGDEF)-like protein n=1 Tax=Actinophytocola oryzae TaxID=502181 RepID=A0A4R7VT78_9PSEU|nr:diguanylate cyclase [Actinophytocola oryzae]TDV52417.1 PAS domain S-box-containing protein/diguanylate cyclase (GGDEF)-like protein [Actinophytocola oryzae]
MAESGVTLPPVHRREELARTWTRSAISSSYIPRSADDIEALLLELVDELLAMLGAEPFSKSSGVRLGHRLISEGFIDPTTLTATITALSDGLLADLDATPDTELAKRTMSLLGAVSAGYADGLRSYTLTQQEEVKQALFNAVLRAEHNLRGTENRFREVFASSANGIAITNLEGMCLEANPALAGILNVRADRLPGRTLTDIFRDEASGDVMAPYRRILSGQQERVHEHRRLRKEDGEIAWVLFAISLLRDGAGAPAYFVTMAQDVTELHLLQDRLGHQLLYDALTGLANRQCFQTKLESAVERATPDSSFTLCCLDLDAFSLVNNSFGHAVGDRLLQTVGRRLEEAVSNETALVARMGGDEFAVLIEDSEKTPDIGELIDTLTSVLEDPEYIDGVGVAVGASVGAVRRQAADHLTAAELFRAADTALRKAKATGRRQWAGFHEAEDRAAVELDRLAASLPAAWENGDLAAAFQPVVRLSDREVVGARAVLSWAAADHETTLALAERTGWSVHIGPLLLREACRLFATSPGLLRVQLTRNQSGDADLVRAVRGALRDSGMSAGRLEVSLDVGALLDEVGDARDNLEVLGDIGVQVGLCGVTGGPLDFELLHQTGVRSVTLSPKLGAGSPVLAAETARTVEVFGRFGAVASVVDVATVEAADWWASTGVATGQGGVFGTR